MVIGLEVIGQGIISLIPLKTSFGHFPMFHTCTPLHNVYYMCIHVPLHDFTVLLTIIAIFLLLDMMLNNLDVLLGSEVFKSGRSAF